MTLKKFVSKLFIFFITRVAFFVTISVSGVFCADARVDFLLFPDVIECDVRVCQKLLASGIGDPCGYWREHVAEKCATIVAQAKAKDPCYWRNILLRFMSEIKCGIITNGLKSVEAQIQALANETISFVLLPLPLPLQDLLDQRAKFLTKAQRADLISKIKIMLDEGIDWLCIDEYLSVHLPRLRFLAKQKGSSEELPGDCVGSLLPWSSSLSKVPARLVSPDSSRSRMSSMRFRGMRNELQKIIDLSADAWDIGDIPCYGCGKNFVPNDIIGLLSIILTDDLNSARLDFALQLPKCSFCAKHVDNFRMLRNVLPVHKRKSLVLKALIRELEPIPEEIFVLLIATNAAYRGIITHSPHGAFLSKSHLALQIFEKDVRMKEGITAHFSNEEVWKR